MGIERDADAHSAYLSNFPDATTSTALSAEKVRVPGLRLAVYLELVEVDARRIAQHLP